jgi:hypothetical protein
MATNDPWAAAAAPVPTKVMPIRENTPEKAELIRLFESKKWDKLPKTRTMTWKRSSRRTTGIGASSNITLKFGINLEPMVPKLLKGQEKKSLSLQGNL